VKTTESAKAVVPFNPDKSIYQSQNQGESAGRKPPLPAPAASKISRRPQHQHALDPLALKMIENVGVVSYQIMWSGVR
jgi:hypothetical protein